MDGAVAPLWVAAVAAVALCGIAVMLTRSGRRAQRTLDARLALVEELYRRDTDQRARAQAQMVCAWPVSERETYQSVIRHGIVGAAVRNASDLPVYNVELVYSDHPAAWTAIRRIKMLPPATEPEVHAGFDEEATVGTPRPERVNADGTTRLAPSADMSLELRFTDAQGVRWVRDEHGTLSQGGAVTEPAPTLAAVAV